MDYTQSDVNTLQYEFNGRYGDICAAILRGEAVPHACLTACNAMAKIVATRSGKTFDQVRREAAACFYAATAVAELRQALNAIAPLLVA